jgi:hypothetical protein
MTTEGCSASICPSEEELRPLRAIACSAAALVFLIFWFILSWRPVVPEVEFVIARLVQSMVFLVSWGLCFKDVQGDGAESAIGCSHFIARLIEPFVWLGNKIQATYDWWQQNKGGQYLKIYVTYLQILSSFNIYKVQWPATFLACINWVRGTVKFEFLKLPNLSCLWYGVSWKTTVFTYTLTPVVMIVVFGIPVLAALCRELHVTAITRWNDTLDRFCRNLTFSFFLMYPMLAMATMSSLNCEPNVGRLRDDLRVICPDLQSSESIYSFAFIALYPIGIPVFNYLCLRHMGIVKVVKEKICRAEFHAMLSLFMMSAAREKANIFNGTEDDPKTLNVDQLQALMLFNGWPSRHKGPQDVGESEDLGGANATLLEREKKASAGDSKQDDDERAEEIAERAERQRNVDAGDIQDPMHREIHELEQELQKRKDAGMEINKKIEEIQMQLMQEEIEERKQLYGQQVKILQQEIRISGEYLSSDNTLNEAITDAKKVYIENPAHVAACLKRIKVKAMPTEELRRSVCELAHRFVADEVIAFAAYWSNPRDGAEDEDKDPSPHGEGSGDPGKESKTHDEFLLEKQKIEKLEQKLMSRFGFLFIAYRVDCWWWEAVEMTR